MKDNFDRYVQGLLERRRTLKQQQATAAEFPFADWPFDVIRQDFKSWRPDTRENYLWVIVKGYNQRTHTKVGCSSDLRASLLENSKKLQCGGGGGSSQRRGKSSAAAPAAQTEDTAAGLCKLVMWVGLPPVRNYSAPELDRSCTKGRGWVSRCSNALALALLHGLDCGLSEELLQEGNPLFIKDLRQSVDATFRRSPVPRRR